MAKAGQLVIDVSAGTAKFIADMEAANGKLRQFGQSAQESGLHVVSSMQASSAAIRLLDNPMGSNMRAVERFISLLPGMGSLLKAAFPVVGALAFADMLGRMGGQVVDFVKQIQQAPEKISGAFRDLNQPLQATNDQLQLANDRLRNEIAALEGKPQNGLAVALDEARVFADKLADSLDKDLGKLNELLTKNEVGFFKSFLAGVRTDDLRKELGGETGFGGFTGRIDELTDRGNAKISGAKTKKEADDARAEMAANLSAAYDAEIGKLTARLNSAKASQAQLEASGVNRHSLAYSSNNQTVNIEETQGALRDLQKQRSFVGLSNTNQSLTEQKTGLEADKANLDKELQQLKEEWNRQLAEYETYQQAFAEDRAQFRSQELQEVIAKYGQQKETVVRFENELRTEVARAQQESIKEYKEAHDRDEKEEERHQLELLHIKTEWAQKANEQLKALSKSMAEAAQTDDQGRQLPDLMNAPLAVRLRMGGGSGAKQAADPIDLHKNGVTTAADMQQQVSKAQQLYELSVQANQPIQIQLELRERILQAQIALLAAQGQGADQQQAELETLKAKQTLLQWNQIGLGTFRADAIGTAMRAPQALGGAVASGAFDGHIGREVGDALKGLGKQLFGEMLTQALEKLTAELGLSYLEGANQTTALAANTAALIANTAAQGAGAGASGASAGMSAASAASAAASPMAAMLGPILGGVISGVISGIFTLIGDEKIVKAVNGTTAAVLSLKGTAFQGSQNSNALTNAQNANTTGNQNGTQSGFGVGGFLQGFFGLPDSHAIPVRIVQSWGDVLGKGLLGGLFGFADGTNSAPGGWSWVGERGPELMNVPRGAQIVPNHRLGDLFPTPATTHSSVYAMSGGVNHSYGGVTFGDVHLHGVQDVREMMRDISQYAKTQDPSKSPFAR